MASKNIKAKILSIDLPLGNVRKATEKIEKRNEKIKQEIELKNILPFSSITLLDKNDDESEEEISESDEEEINESLNNFFGHFD